MPTSTAVKTRGSAPGTRKGQNENKIGQKPNKVGQSQQDGYSFGGSKSPFWSLPQLCPVPLTDREDDSSDFC